MDMKKWIALILALILMLGLAACNHQEKADAFLKDYEAAVNAYVAADTDAEKQAALDQIFALEKQKEEVEKKLEDEARKEFNRTYQELLSKAAEVA
jgi:uncharacterized lipoprotein YehR (DUF1307 family)